MHVLLLAHGSPAPQHAPTMRAVRDAVRERGVWCEAAFLDHDTPSPADAVAELPAGAELVAVPMLLNRAYHARVDVPAAVRAVDEARPDLVVRTAAALGPDPLLVQAMERRLREAGVDLAASGAGVVDPGPAGRLAVVLVASGTSDERARADVAATAGRWAEQRGVVVRHAFVAGGGPHVADAVTDARSEVGADGVVALAPYLFEDGVLLDRATRAARAAGVDVVAAGLAAAPEVVDLVLVRARSAT